MTTPVNTIDMNGTTFVMPADADIIVRFQDGAGKLHDTRREAEMANARIHLKKVIDECIDYRGYDDWEVNVDDLIKSKTEIIAALEMFP